MLECASSNTAQIARQMARINHKSFQTNEKALYRLLNDPEFQIDDLFWRCYLKMIFVLLQAQKIVSKNEKVFIQIDFTSNKNNFLILCASIRCKTRAIPLFFTMRRYPKKAGMIDQKKMELAFLKELRHLLSKKYHYVLVADRGFGNQRFIGHCEELGFDYLIRLSTDKYIQKDNEKILLSSLSSTEGIERFEVLAWKREIALFVSASENASEAWYIATSLSGYSIDELCQEYQRRFKIEKVFQDLKSAGFDIEGSKIKKYDRYKRLLFLSMMIHALMILIGKTIDEDYPELKKKSPILSEIISVYFSLPDTFYPYISKKL